MKNKGFAAIEALLIVLIIGALAGVGWYVYKNQDSSSTTDDVTFGINSSQAEETEEATEAEPLVLQTGTFSTEGEYGTVQVKGYVTTELVNESFCNTNCDKVEYVFFNVIETPNQSFLNYLKDNSGNAFVQDTAIGLGCKSEELLVAEQRRSKIEFSESDSATILNSSSESPINLELYREKPPEYGTGAPACFSQLTAVTVL